MPIVHDGPVYTIRADKTGYYVWANIANSEGKWVRFLDIESMLRYTGLEITEPADFIRVTAARFHEPEPES